MKYELSDAELLDFAKGVFETAVGSYLDLKDSTCESILSKFLEGKKSIASNTHLNLHQVVSLDGTFFGSSVITNTDNTIFTTRAS